MVVKVIGVRTLGAEGAIALTFFWKIVYTSTEPIIASSLWSKCSLRLPSYHSALCLDRLELLEIHIYMARTRHTVSTFNPVNVAMPPLCNIFLRLR